ERAGAAHGRDRRARRRGGRNARRLEARGAPDARPGGRGRRRGGRARRAGGGGEPDDAAARGRGGARARPPRRGALPRRRRAAARRGAPRRRVVPAVGLRGGDRAPAAVGGRARDAHLAGDRRARAPGGARGDALRLPHRAADAAGGDRAVARADQGAGGADRALPQLRPLLEDRGDLRVGAAGRGARDHRGGGA
ncbi:MAG: hypothetical protein AVDCRST_MAG40-2630, partial [uncultured Gemmatimonadaceae bacterium]